MSHTIVWGNAPLQWQQLVQVARQGATLALSDSAWQRIAQGRDIVGSIVAAGQVAYGINTGLGALYNIILTEDELSQLSRNTLLSHAGGVGPCLGKPEVRVILCAAIANYSHGKSGVSVALVERLLALLNLQITPQVPSQGSVGYLTHMAHISLALIGTGEVEWEGQLMPAQPAVLDNYVTSGVQEDQLSLGTGSALKLLKLVSNVEHIIAIEYLLVAQALEFHDEARLASGTLRAWRHLRQSVASWHRTSPGW